ncbi:hypothetical protein ACPXB3_10490 [Gordonia sp. DT219]|uniref:hypothetical protein n=1 Tax=Gordonia sp. DT219 TaxID=3416658 RepID=UPI003CEC2365
MSTRSGQGDRPRGRGTGGDERRASAADRAPTPIRVAGALTAAEGVAALVVAVILVVRGLTDDRHDAFNGLGTALWLAIIFGGVLAGGLALIFGRRWGRAISVVAQILLLPVAYYLFTSHQAVFAVPLAILALVTLGFLFAPPSLRWLAGDLELDGVDPDGVDRGGNASGRDTKGQGAKGQGTKGQCAKGQGQGPKGPGSKRNKRRDAR